MLSEKETMAIRDQFKYNNDLPLDYYVYEFDDNKRLFTIAQLDQYYTKDYRNNYYCIRNVHIPCGDGYDLFNIGTHSEGVYIVDNNIDIEQYRKEFTEYGITEVKGLIKEIEKFHELYDKFYKITEKYMHIMKQKNLEKIKKIIKNSINIKEK